jgi:hypothetical protein
VCADSIGHRIYSGIGGQMDFVRGAALSNGGKPIIALPSTARGRTLSRIVPVLQEGAGVVTSRAHVHYVVTEHGVAYLHGRSIRERAQALIAIADPAFRPELGEPWQVAKVYWTAMPKSLLARGFEHFKASGDPFFSSFESADDIPFGTPDEIVTSRVSAPEHLERKHAAMRAHRSQIDLNGPFFALPEEMAREAFGTEHFVLGRGERGPGDGPNGWETDLFSGVA